ncbi:hypothetical protein HGA88_03725 [Candidatus Roizmanbacteria bacterium]|nr:hypothetical protein [Candidatus Roizmanbacteria bacterium]
MKKKIISGVRLIPIIICIILLALVIGIYSLIWQSTPAYPKQTVHHKI